MKYKKLEAILLFALIIISSSSCSTLSTKAQVKKPASTNELPKDDGVLNRIKSYIYQFAEKVAKRSDLKLKRKISGQLPDSYPKVMIENAKRSRLDKTYWNKILTFPTKIWRICVYPESMFKLNIMHWCEEKYGSKHPKKLAACKNTFCTVCCDHLRIILKNQAQKQILGEMLWLKNNPGFNKIVKSITDHDLKKCSRTCSRTYPVNFPVTLPPPPRDKRLGSKPEFAAKNCKDIQVWGPHNPKSGEYWVELGLKGKTKVYCDMETDKGGWMLFFNYLHYPGQEVYLDSSRMPSNLKKNHHVNLKEVGFSENEITDLRFFCTERSSKKVFWHFKLNSPDFINTAMTGDQRFLKKQSLLTSGYFDLPFPGQPLKWVRIVDRDRLSRINYVGQNRNGGFWDSPFGSNKYQKYWTVKGNVKKGGRFECGSAHKDGSTNPNAALVMTHHTIWIRGMAASDKEARERFVSRSSNFK